MRRLVCLVAAACALCSCKKQVATDNSALPQNVLARVGSEVITVEDFQEAMRARPVGNNAAARTALLDELIEFRVLVQEAKARGLDRDPKTQQAFERFLANRMRTELAAARPSASEITPEEVEHYYHEHEKDFKVPARVRAAMIFVEAPGNFTDEKRAERRARIEEARTRSLAEAKSTQLGFGPLAAEYSFDQATKYKGGDLGYLLEGLTGADANALEPQVSAAAFALTEAGQVSDIVETPKGYYLLKLGERQPGASRPLASIRNEISARLRRERAASRKTNYTAELIAGKNVEVHRDRLAAIPVPSSAQPATRESASPPPLPDE
jgi:parvulin-like peptidyl-prolyl isomerase